MISDNAAALAILLETLSRKRIRQLVADQLVAGEIHTGEIDSGKTDSGTVDKTTASAVALLRRRSRLWRGRIAELRRHCRELEIALCAPGEPGFPERLAAIPDPPLLTFQRGNPACLEGPAVAIVGARRASRLGLETAYTLARTLANSGIHVVSGLALGIDSAAHEGAVSVGLESVVGGQSVVWGQTIAVLGSGLGFVQPVTNIPVAEAIVSNGGLLISEYPIATRARPHHFPERNRIISGLADVIVVIEAGERSGSLITARLALEQGREVLAVPGAISLPNSRGVNWLLKQGAGVVDSAQDVVDALEAQGVYTRLAPATPRAGTASAGRSEAPSPAADLSAAAQGLLAEIRDFTTTPDELCVSCGESAARVAVLLAELEIKGFVARTGGGYIRRPFNSSSGDRP